MNNRLPIYVLGLLVLVALMWRISNPPKPPMPGPKGEIPHWISAIAIGEPGPSATNPNGTCWAGTWFHKDRQGAMESAVVIIDLIKQTSQQLALKKGFAASSLVWQDQKQFYVLLVDSQTPSLITRSTLVRCTVNGQTWEASEKAIDTDIASIITWPPGSDRLVVQLAGSPVRTAMMDRDGGLIGKPSTPDVSEDTRFHPAASISKDGGAYVFGAQKTGIGGIYIFQLADSNTGKVTRLFESRVVPGIIQGVWLSSSGVLIVSAERGSFHVLMSNPESPGKPSKIKAGEVEKAWPDAPKSMTFAAFNGGYEVDLRTGKSKLVLEFDTSDKQTAHWRGEIQDGRLYPRPDGDYTSVSYAAGTVDIRLIKKDGSDARPILPRR